MPSDWFKTWLAACFISIAFATLLVAMPIATFNVGREYWLLTFDGVATEATVATKIEIRRRFVRKPLMIRTSKYYYATYTFKDGAGQVRTGRQRISANLHYEFAARGNQRSATIRFVRGKPEINVLSMPRMSWTLVVFSSVSVALWAGLLLLVIWWLWQRRADQMAVLDKVRRTLLVDNARRSEARNDASARPIWLDQWKRRSLMRKPRGPSS